MLKYQREIKTLLWSSLLWVSFTTSPATAHPKCCEEENFIVNGTCLDNTEINIESKECLVKFVLAQTEYVIAENNSLILLKPLAEFTTDKYCETKSYETRKTVAIICETELPEEKSYILRTSCSFVSVVFLILTVVIYFIVPQLRDLQGKCIIHTMIGLGAGFFFLAITQITENISEGACVFLAFMIYMTFLLAFFWLNVVAFHVWRKINKPNDNRSDKFWYVVYCLYTYGSTAVFIIVTLATHQTDGDHVKPGFGEGTCFFGSELPTWAYFYGPISVLLAINLILFTHSCIKLWSPKHSQNLTGVKSSKYKCLLTMKLFFIMGLFWIFEVLSYALEDVHYILNYLWILTDYLNALQGVLIFLVLVVFRKKTLRGLANSSCLGSRFPRSWQTLEDEECLDEEEESKASNI